MTIQKKIKLVLLRGGKNNEELAALYGISKPYLGRKIRNGKLTANELLQLAELCGCSLAFNFENGESVKLELSDIK